MVGFVSSIMPANLWSIPISLAFYGPTSHDMKSRFDRWQNETGSRNEPEETVECVSLWSTHSRGGRCEVSLVK